MQFIRRKLFSKGLFLLLLLAGTLFASRFLLKKAGIEAIPADLVNASVIVLLALLFGIYVADVILPIQGVTKQVTNLLTGKNYQRVEPATIDEIGVLTHFFNEITQDLEKVSYDIKERRRMSSELDIAATIQRDVLPKAAPSVPGFDIVAKNRPATSVGGDVFDFLESPDKNNTYIYVGDATGHGVPAGLVMMMANTLVQAMVSQGLDNSRDVMVQTNGLLGPRISNRLFLTMVLLRWHRQDRKMFYTGAGHEHILIYRQKSETVEAIRSGGIALGMIPDISKIAQEREIPLEVGDTIVLYSDGITEAKNKTGEMFGLERLKTALQRNGYKPSAESIFDSVTKEFVNFVREYVQIDDITMMVIKYTGKEAGASGVKLTVASHEAPTAHANPLWDWTY